MLGKPFKKVPFRRHVQLTLPAVQVEKIKTVSIESAKLFDYVMDCVEIGCSVTFSPNEKGGYTASIQAIEPEHRSAGLAVYSNAPTMREAVAVMVFKMDEVSPKSDWSQKEEQRMDSGYR